MKRWRGRPASEYVLTVDCGGAEGKPGRIYLVTAPWVKPEPCTRCGRPTLMRFNAYPTTVLYPAHVECAKVTLAELMDAA
jgi:hypothetical protein